MNSRIEEQVTALEYARAVYRMKNATSENERIQMESVARWLRKKIDEYRRKNDTRVQGNEEKNRDGGVSDMRSVWGKNNESR